MSLRWARYPEPVAATDTTDEAAAVQREVWRKLGPEGRIRVAFEMSEELRQITLAEIRRRNPDWSESDAVAELIWRMHEIDIRAPRPMP